MPGTLDQRPTDATATAPSRPRYWIRTYGCQMNAHDSEIYAGQLRELGFEAADGPTDANIILVNTCSVREKAEEKLFSELGRLRELKDGAGCIPADSKRRNGVRIGVTGCIAQQRGEGIIEREGSVDFVLGTRALRALPEVLDALTAGEGPQVVTEDRLDFDTSDAVRSDRVKAFVTIMEGCNNYCSFCIVPSTRGLEIYRPAAEILDEVRGLGHRGFREVTLLGQNVNSWTDPGSGMRFPELLVELDAAAAETEPGGIERIRFLTSHPKDLSSDLIEAMAGCRRVANHLHLPVQSGSDEILQQMNRHYTTSAFLEIVSRLRAAVPGVGLSTDLIVGFPGETDADFDATIALVRATEFDSFYSFEYSPRPGTTAARLDDMVPAEVKRRRLLRLQSLQREIQLRKNEARVGQTLQVLIDGISKRSATDVCGRSESNHVVNLPGPAAWIGHLVDARITDFGPHSLSGEAVTAPL